MKKREEKQILSKLCLGTVQFGMKYGINNQLGRQPTMDESFSMLDYAISNGIGVIDTAAAYGEAEELLGSYLKKRQCKQEVKIISKLKPNIIDNGSYIEKKVIEECKCSLRRLSIEQLDGYLLHTPEYIYDEDIIAALLKLKQDGYVKNIGVSIYRLKEGYASVNTGLMDYIQMPYSILDQRVMKEGFIPFAKKAGIKIFTRSVFLQGLFMMDQKSVPGYLKNALPYLEIMEKILYKYDVDKVSGILKFVQYEKDIDYLVFGVEKIEQLKENILKSKNGNMPEQCIQELKERINNVNQSVILPSLWSNGKKVL